jgi:hypothetical protein
MSLQVWHYKDLSLEFAVRTENLSNGTLNNLQQINQLTWETLSGKITSFVKCMSGYLVSVQIHAINTPPPLFFLFATTLFRDSFIIK